MVERNLNMDYEDLKSLTKVGCSLQVHKIESKESTNGRIFLNETVNFIQLIAPFYENQLNRPIRLVDY